MQELNSKLARLYGAMDAQGVTAVHLSQAGSFAWITGGASSYINTASSYGAAQALITRKRHSILTTNIEAPRIAQEEGLEEQGWEVIGEPWYEEGAALARLTAGMSVGADAPGPDQTDLGGEIAWLRSVQTEPEQARFRTLGRLCAEAMDEAIRRVRPGMSEQELAALLADATQRRGVQAIVNLIATDERIFYYRHPLPTDKRLERYAMLVLCGRKAGQVCSITRLVHFGPLPDELAHKLQAVAAIDAAIIAKTRPGRPLSHVFDDIRQAYADTGFPDEWKLHHQGGPAGYEPREVIVTPDFSRPVEANQIYAWNPSITGVKSEDTILVGAQGNEIITAIDGWPVINVDVDGALIARPGILIV
ncbi:MAG: M24 family metallopeptidase [Caldilineaceae bacterium]|nr:M24 family metallopeptidase [Caldilineaceae bacterium]